MGGSSPIAAGLHVSRTHQGPLADWCSTWMKGGALFVYSVKGSQLPSMSQIHACASVMLKNVNSGASGPL